MSWTQKRSGIDAGQMKTLDLIKATVVCGALAYAVYSVPVISQVLIIGVLSLVWLSYAYKAVKPHSGR